MHQRDNAHGLEFFGQGKKLIPMLRHRQTGLGQERAVNPEAIDPMDTKGNRHVLALILHHSIMRAVVLPLSSGLL